MDSYPLVSVITVNYAKANITCEMIASLKSVTYPNYEIIVIDNASDEDPSLILEKYPEIKLIRTVKNIGFAGANNLGIRRAKGDFMLFLNNDTEVDPMFLEPLIEVLKRNNNIGAVSPKVIYHNSNIIQYAGANKINPITGRAFSLNYQEEDSGQANALKPTYYAFGAAMMIPKKIIEKIGPMPEMYFMYYEEIEWCEKIWKSGHEVYYAGNSTIYHKDTLSIKLNSPLKTYYLSRNRILFLRRNTEFLQQCISFAYFNFVIIPRQVVMFIVNRNFVHLKFYLKALLWHLTHIKGVNP